MKTRLLSAIALAVVLLTSCSQGKDEQAEKIKALEEKLLHWMGPMYLYLQIWLNGHFC